MSASNYAELKTLDHIFGISSFAQPTIYVALCTDDPTDAGTGASMNVLADSNSYARVDASGDFGTAAASGSISNDDVIAFPEATGSWGTVTYFAILDSGTHGAGNLLFSGALDTSRAVASGDTPRFAIGELTVTAD